MKSIKKNLEWAAKILSLLILFQSCTVYHSYTSTVDEALATNDKVELKVGDGEFPYKFKRIKVFDNQYYGLVKIKSDTYRRMRDRKKLDSDNSKFCYVQLYENEIANIHLKNNGASTALTVTMAVIGLGALIGIGALVVDNNIF